MTGGEWKLCDDSRPWDDQAVYCGPGVLVKTLLRAIYASETSQAELPSGTTVTILPGNGYVEDPAGRQFDWNKHTSSWENLDARLRHR